MERTNRIVAIVLFLAAIAISVNAEDPHKLQMEEIRKEIKAINVKTKEVRDKITHTLEKASKDSAAYADYQKENDEHVYELMKERDSLSLLVKQLNEKRDEIESTTETVEMRKVNYKHLTLSVQNFLVKNCKEMLVYLEKYKPFNMDRQVGALGFLAGELSAGAVDAIEGIERYYQILKQIEKHSESTEAWKQKAPGALLKGEVSYLRLGLVWLACINADNTKGLTWDGKEQKWVELTNNAQILNIRKAVNLASGSAAPQLVALPFNHNLNVEKTMEAGNE